VLSEKEPVGRLATAEYGFDGSTGEVILEEKKANALTLALTKE